MSISVHMNKYLFRASFFKKLPMLTLCISACLLMTSCVVYHAGGAKLYNAKTSTKEGIWFVNAFNVKLLCEDVYGFFGTDFYVSKNCIYAFVIRVDSSKEIPELPEGKFWDYWRKDYELRKKYADKLNLAEKTIHFRPIKEEFVEKLGLEPNFSWWEKYGFMIVAVVAYLIFQLCLTEMFPDEKRDWRNVAYHFLIIVLIILPIVIVIRICGTWL